MLRAFLRPGPADRVIDLGCGSGRVLAWNRDLGAYQVGIDVSPFFAVEARRDIDLALGDLRRLPFADGAFTKAYALDVFEHLSRNGLDDVLREAARVLDPGGQLFVYSHVRKNSRLAGGLRLINRAARRLERAGAIDLSQERLRKSDHLNPLADIPDLVRVVGAAGFRIARIRYYTPLVGGVVENILLRVAERWLARRNAAGVSFSSPDASSAASDRAGEAAADADRGQALRAARTAAKARIARRGPVYAGLRALTAAMKLDVILFGRIRSGPFFALLEKTGTGDRRA
jgi:SAM-dependent methyltransferase